MEKGAAPRNRPPHSAAERETIAAVATPPGSGALAVLRLSGAAALKASSFLKPKGGAPLEPRRATLCEARSIDEVVATFFPASSSPTGEDLVEISCHGSPYIVERLMDAVLHAGARKAAPGEFTQRAFLNGKMDLIQAESVCDLIAARTAQAHKTAMSQLEGGLSIEIARLREPIIDLLVRIEANLDHPEEDLPAMSAEEFRRTCEAAEKSVSAAAATYERGRLIREGAKIAIVGRPNAGKSSLLNALIGRDRAIVCPEPGTTRDTLEEEVDLGGSRCVLIDTAGLREEAGDAAEKIGIERTRRTIKESDLTLLVMDGSRELSVDDRRVHEKILADAAEQVRLIVPVVSKADLPVRVRDFPGDPVRVSSVTGEGMGELVGRLRGTLMEGAEREPVVVTSVRHHQALLRCASELASSGKAPAAHPGRWEDRAARHLREALGALDEITGATAADEVLAAVFSRFCVGK